MTDIGRKADGGSWSNYVGALFEPPHIVFKSSNKSDQAVQNTVHNFAAFQNFWLDIKGGHNVIAQRILPTKIEVIHELVELFSIQALFSTNRGKRNFLFLIPVGSECFADVFV